MLTALRQFEALKEFDQEYTTAFRDFLCDHSMAVRDILKDCQMKGLKVAGYGASTKGNVLLQLAGITPDLLPVIAEVNEDKFGCVTPGTNIPIQPEEEVRPSTDVFFVLPWHFRRGIELQALF